MSRILITGSAQGLGRGAATTLLDDGHQVVVHARDTGRVAERLSRRLEALGHHVTLSAVVA